MERLVGAVVAVVAVDVDEVYATTELSQRMSKLQSR
jgi:hypothetical protein